MTTDFLELAKINDREEKIEAIIKYIQKCKENKLPNGDLRLVTSLELHLKELKSAKLYLILSSYLAQKGLNPEAEAYAREGLALFQDEFEITRALWLILAEVLYYCDKKEEGLEYCNKVLFTPGLTFPVFTHVFRFIGNYLERLPLGEKILIPLVSPPGYFPSSPSLLKTETGYDYNVRFVNYIINAMGGYIMSDPDQYVRTKNFLYKLNQDLEVQERKELIVPSELLKFPTRIKGIEDVRIFGERQFFAVCLETNKPNQATVNYGEYDQEGTVTKLIPLKVGDNFKTEKNWLPIIKDGIIYFIYSFEPLKIYKLDPDGSLELFKETKKGTASVDTFRGSATPIEYKGGYLMTIHQVLYTQPRLYYHRFVWMNQEMDQIKWSKLFFFEKPEIEYNLGLCDYDEKNFLFAYSHRDHSAVMKKLKKQVVNEMLGI